MTLSVRYARHFVPSDNAMLCKPASFLRSLSPCGFLFFPGAASRLLPGLVATRAGRCWPALTWWEVFAGPPPPDSPPTHRGVSASLRREELPPAPFSLDCTMPGTIPWQAFFLALRPPYVVPRAAFSRYPGVRVGVSQQNGQRTKKNTPGRPQKAGGATALLAMGWPVMMSDREKKGGGCGGFLLSLRCLSCPVRGVRSAGLGLARVSLPALRVGGCAPGPAASVRRPAGPVCGCRLAAVASRGPPGPFISSWR